MKFQVTKREANAETKADLIRKIPSLAGKKILIIGDVGLDEYIMGSVRRISPEAPVPVVEVESEDSRLGLAANVAQNVSSLGGIPLMVSVVGDDLGAAILRDICAKNGVGWDHMITDKGRPTTRKTRVMAKHHHIVRVDHELKRYLNSETETRLLEKVCELIPSSDIVVVEDYAKGVISQKLVSDIAQKAKELGKRVLVDPHRDTPGSFYRGVDLIKPNYEEAVALSGLKFEELRDNPEKVYEVGRALQKHMESSRVVMTRGQDGMTIFEADAITEVPTYAQKVFDVTGAGDTVIAALSLGLAAGFSLVDSCMLANFAAGVVVGKIGCVPCEVQELIQYINEH